MSLLSFVEWLAATRISTGIHESVWAFPIIETVHVLGLCLFLGMAVLWDLRLLGGTFRSVRATEVSDRLLPWMWVGAVIMVVSGIFTFLNDPIRYYNNIFFRIKFVMLLLAVLNAWVFQAGVYRKIARWDLEAHTPLHARMAGALSITLWAGIVIARRMIAYNWFDKH